MEMMSKLLKSLKSEFHDKIDLLCVGESINLITDDVNLLDKDTLVKSINDKINKINKKKK